MLAIQRRTQGFAAPGTRFRMVLAHPTLGTMRTPNHVYVNGPDCFEWGGGALGAKVHGAGWRRTETRRAGPSLCAGPRL